LTASSKRILRARRVEVGMDSEYEVVPLRIGDKEVDEEPAERIADPWHEEALPLPAKSKTAEEIEREARLKLLGVRRSRRLLMRRGMVAGTLLLVAALVALALSLGGASDEVGGRLTVGAQARGLDSVPHHGQANGPSKRQAVERSRKREPSGEPDKQARRPATGQYGEVGEVPVQSAPPPEMTSSPVQQPPPADPVPSTPPSPEAGATSDPASREFGFER
jgi:hypothetical protein